MPRRLAAAVALVPAATLIAGACQPPTQITLDVSTDVDCASFTTSIFAGAGPDLGDVPQTETDQCASGRVGTLVLTPSGARDGRVLVRVVGRAPGLQPIEARRSIRYLERRPLVLPIRLSRACAGVVCKDGETCVDGECRSAEVDPETCLADGGCGEGTLPRLDGGADATTDAATDAGDAGPLMPVQTIAAGGNTNCARTWSGAIRCWGDNAMGQCGAGTMPVNVPSQYSAPAPAVTLGMGTIGVAVGDGFACALGTSNGLGCWGSNIFGQLARGNASMLEPPGATLLAPAVGMVAAGWGHACATLGGDPVPLRCWGQGPRGTLGSLMMGFFSATPIGFPGLAPAALAVGREHICVVQGVKLFCWGARGASGHMSDTPAPEGVLGLPDAKGAAAGDGFTCALLSSGRVRCFGVNNVGQCGVAPSPDHVPTGSDVRAGILSLVGVTELAAGGAHACAVDAKGDVWCWGLNDTGQLGDGTTTDRSEATRVVGLSGPAEHVAAGHKHTCVTLKSSGVRCWGRNDEGQLGNMGGGGLSSATPVAVQGL